MSRWCRQISQSPTTSPQASTSRTPASSQRPSATSAGTAQIQPNGVQPATVAASASSPRSRSTPAPAKVPTRLAPTPNSRASPASPTKAKSRNRRELSTAAKVVVPARESRKQVTTPIGMATTVASTGPGPRDQLASSPSDTSTVATPVLPTSPDTSNPGMICRARTGSSAKRAGSRVSSTPNTSSDSSSQPAVSVAKASTVTSAVTSTDVQRRATRPTRVITTMPSA